LGKVDVDLIRQARQAAGPGTSGAGTKAALARADLAGKPSTRECARTAANPPDPRFGREALLQATIGHAVRAGRRRHDLNGVALAKAAGISLAMLSRIENGTVSPSLATLQALASALGMPVTALLQRYNEQSRAVFIKAGDGPSAGSGPRYHAVLGQTEAGCDGMAVKLGLTVLAEPSDMAPAPRHKGLHFLYVLEGDLVYRHGAARFRMTTGDSLLCEAHASHGPESLVRSPSRILSLIAYQQDAAAD
jgi:transcriptional regulator with XRE-family HTH domain